MACRRARAGNERHWCHFCAFAPAGIYAIQAMGEIRPARRASTAFAPYFSCLDFRRTVTKPAGVSRRLVASPAHKEYARSSAATPRRGRVMRQKKRDAPDLFKPSKHVARPGVHRWTHTNGRINQIRAALSFIQDFLSKISVH